MNQEIKQKWVAALRSGEYVQGLGALNISGKFCCLGVLCDLHAKETGNVWKGEDGVLLPKKKKYEEQTAVLPKVVQRWAELPHNNPDIPGRRSLASLNDAGKTFIEIADLIETTL
jgi:hypothetical protein